MAQAPLPAPPQATTLPSLKRAPLAPGEDPRALFEEGLGYLRELAGLTWTDHNLHDPGITTLEMLSLALAELGFKAGTPIADWLAEPRDAQTGITPDLARQFFQPREALPNRPLTRLDWRKLLIDLDGVKNAWVYPEPAMPLYADLVARELAYAPPAHGHSQRVALQGLYRVKVDFMDHITTQADQEAVVQRVHDALQANRNLCEACGRHTKSRPGRDKCTHPGAEASWPLHSRVSTRWRQTAALTTLLTFACTAGAQHECPSVHRPDHGPRDRTRLVCLACEK